MKYKNLEIIDYSYDSKGIAKHDDLIIFVPNTIVGEIVDIKIIQTKKNIAQGVVENIVKKSSMRQDAICKHYDVCGGCNLLHMKYEEQVNFKLKTLNNTLSKFKISYVVDNIIKSDEIYKYRNKVTYKFFPNYDIGFVREKSHDGFDLEECYLQDDKFMDIISDLKVILKTNKESSYNLRTKKGNLKNIVLKKTKSGEILVDFITTLGRMKNEKELVEILTKHKEIVNITVNTNTKNNNYNISFQNRVLYGEDKLVETVKDKQYYFGASSFFQVNHAQMEKLYDEVNKVCKYKNKSILDAFCGTGTIGIGVYDGTNKIIGIDNNKEAIKMAKKNAKLNDVKAKFICNDVHKEIITMENNDFDIVIIDPPRKGVEESFLNILKGKKVKELVYVSCNPATLARDINILGEEYKVDSIVAVDMFVNTHHVEMVVKLSRKG